MERMKKMKPEWKDLRRKPAVKDLRNRLGRLYQIQQDYEKLIRAMLDINCEKIENDRRGRDRQEEKDLLCSLDFMEEQREALLGQRKVELKRFYRLLETVESPKVKLILVLRHVHFLSWKDIAEALGTSVKRVKYLHEEFIIES